LKPVRRVIIVCAALWLGACGRGESDAVDSASRAETGGAGIGAAPGSAHQASDPHQALSPTQHIKVALQHRDEGRLGPAIETLTRALASYGDNKQLLAVRSNLYLENKETSAALRDLNAALKLDSRDAGLLVNRASAYQKFGRTEDALADLDKALEIDGNMLAAYFNRGTILYGTGDYHRALADFTRCTEIDAAAAGPYFNRAAVHDVLGNREAAVSDVRQFIALTDNPAWKDKARFLLDQWESESNERRSDS